MIVPRTGTTPHLIKKKKKARKTEDPDDPQTYIVALEKVEAWNFSRIVESIWWQVIFLLSG